MSNTLGTMIARAGQRYGDRVALTDGTKGVTYRQFVERGSRLANHLAGQGLQPGDRLAVMVEDRLEALEVFAASFLGGFPIVPVNARFKSGEAQYALEDSGARAFVHTDGLNEVVTGISGLDDLAAFVTIGSGERPNGAAAYEDVLAGASSAVPVDTRQPEDLAVLGYTSGTTGYPKGAMCSHRAVLGCTKLIPFAYRLQMYGRCAFSGSLSFVSALWGVLLPHIYTGGTIRMLGKLDIDTWFRAMEEDKSTFTYVPTPLMPAFAAEIRKRPHVLEHLSSAMHSASKAPRDRVADLVDAIGDRFVETFGMTESVAPVTITTREDMNGLSRADDVFDSVGRPLANARVWCVDDDGNPVPAGAEGEILVEADTLFSGYWGLEEKTAEVFDGTVYRTGDIGRFDAAGYLYVTDRKKDMIVSGGANVYPAEVEICLAGLPGIVECAVLGLPDDRWGEAVTAVVVARPDAGLTEDRVVDHVRERLASYKKPTKVFFVDVLPRNASLKVQKHVLREQLTKGE